MIPICTGVVIKLLIRIPIQKSAVVTAGMGRCGRCDRRPGIWILACPVGGQGQMYAAIALEPTGFVYDSRNSRPRRGFKRSTGIKPETVACALLVCGLSRIGRSIWMSNWISAAVD